MLNYSKSPVFQILLVLKWKYYQFLHLSGLSKIKVLIMHNSLDKLTKMTGSTE